MSGTNEGRVGQRFPVQICKVQLFYRNLPNPVPCSSTKRYSKRIDRSLSLRVCFCSSLDALEESIPRGCIFNFIAIGALSAENDSPQWCGQRFKTANFASARTSIFTGEMTLKQLHRNAIVMWSTTIEKSGLGLIIP